MIDNISSLILEKRKLFVFIILMITGFMAYMSQFVQLNYDFSQTVPDSDPDMIYYNEFKDTFGEDGNVFAIGLKDSSIFELNNFIQYQNLIDNVKGIEGVKGALGLSTLQILKKILKIKILNLFQYLRQFQNHKTT